jgi:hypothetical protein
MVVQPALIGWEAKNRRVDTIIERAFNGEELVRRMKGWVTVDPSKLIEVVREFGRLKVLDDKELVIEMKDLANFHDLQKALNDAFGSELDLELIQKK